MIRGEILISTTWAASTSFIPFDVGMQNAHDYAYRASNRGIYATTLYVSGVWEYQKQEEDTKDYFGSSASRRLYSNQYGGQIEMMSGMEGPMLRDAGNAFSPGTMIEAKVRKLKALKASPNRSGIQVNRQLVKGNKIVFKYVAQGELVRP